MESFYGGRKGISFIISKRFDGIDIPKETVRTGNYYATDIDGNFLIFNDAPIVRTPYNEDDPAYIWRHQIHDGSEVIEGSGIYFKDEWAQGMVQFFAEGPNTTSEVGYGEYVIIDTIAGLHNYNTIENGIVYRRGMDYQQKASEKPEEKIFQPGAGAEYIGQVIGPQGETPIVNMDTIENIEKDSNFHNANSGKVAYTEANGSLVSGKENDVIEFAWVEMLDIFGNNIGVKLGFTFPYTVFEMVAERVDAYTDPVFTRMTQPLEEGGDNNKPYFYKWKITIPEGLHGIDSKDIVVYDTPEGKRLGYTQVDYTNTGEGEETFIDIGEYKMISGVTLSSDGILTVAYTYGQPTPMDEVIKWIEEDALTGTKGIELADDGTITVNYNTGEKNIYQNALTWITEASLEETGEFKMLFNNNAKVNNIEKTLEWVRRVEVADDGTLTFYYNTIDENGNEKIAFKRDKFLKVISDVQINTGAAEGEGSQKVVITYNTGESEEIGNGLNYIIETKITDEPSTRNYSVGAYHLLVLYADPDKRGNVSYPSDVFGEVRNDWVDLGYIRGEAGGLHIIGDFDSISKLQDADGQWLPPTEVEGWTEERAGWSYTIDGKAIYSYDYLNNRWYSIGDLTLAEPDEIIIIDTETNGKPSSLDSVLHNKGLWLVAEPIKFAE